MVKNTPASARDAGSIPGLGRFPGGGLGNPFQYSCLENPTDRGTWQATVHGVAKSQTRVRQTEQLSTGYFFFFTLQYCIGFAIHQRALKCREKPTMSCGILRCGD